MAAPASIPSTLNTLLVSYHTAASHPPTCIPMMHSHTFMHSSLSTRTPFPIPVPFRAPGHFHMPMHIPIAPFSYTPPVPSAQVHTLELTADVINGLLRQFKEMQTKIAMSDVPTFSARVDAIPILVSRVAGNPDFKTRFCASIALSQRQPKYKCSFDSFCQDAHSFEEWMRYNANAHPSFLSKNCIHESEERCNHGPNCRFGHVGGMMRSLKGTHSSKGRFVHAFAGYYIRQPTSEASSTSSIVSSPLPASTSGSIPISSTSTAPPLAIPPIQIPEPTPPRPMTSPVASHSPFVTPEEEALWLSSGLSDKWTSPAF